MREGGERLTNLRQQTEERSRIRGLVCAALPEKLAAHVASAGIDDGRLTIGVVGAAWAARLRYLTAPLKLRIQDSSGIEIRSVRLKVVPPPRGV